ncbi:MAG: YbaB/EbfC family nucleoid-associated protein [Armatimonadetes bacterium]|nr:YbaB/EbfC family nucleoid-associated protein [Armatimonadota bacterium]
MKLPKQFGQGGMGDMMKKAQDAMARAQTLEQELALERFDIDKNGVKVTFDGTGQIHAVKIDAALVDKDDVETLEDMLVIALREGFDKATSERQARVDAIMGGMPQGLGLPNF